VGSSNMGPVPGFTSSISDPLIFVVAAKTNDFGSGDPRTPAKQSYRYCEVAAT